MSSRVPKLASALGSTLLLLCASHAAAAPLRVGAGETYANPCAAVAQAKPKDVIEIMPGTYRDSCALGVAGLTLRGVGGRPKIDLSGTDHPAQYKGIYVVTADDVTLENLELTGAHISADNGENAAGVRVEAKGLTIRSCLIHANQNGVLGGTSGALTIEHTEFRGNGLGNGCNDSGCTHNVYVANIDTLTFRFNWSHDIASDTADKGHLLKSRAKANYILYNRISGEGGPNSYEIELPNGGLALVLGNLVQKGKQAGNPTLLSWGAEGASNPDKRLFVVNNTFVNELGKGTFIQAPGAMLSAKNNVFVGAGTLFSGGALSADNLAQDASAFVAPAQLDYHLKQGAAPIGKAVSAGMADQFSLAAISEYSHPVTAAPRASVRDLGAFEYGSATQPAADAGAPAADAGSSRGDAGAGAMDAGVLPSADASNMVDAGDEETPPARDGDAASEHDAAARSDAGPDDDASAGKSGCTLAARTHHPSTQPLAGLVLSALAIAFRRRVRTTTTPTR
jgi:hypothetical protein